MDESSMPLHGGFEISEIIENAGALEVQAGNTEVQEGSNSGESGAQDSPNPLSVLGLQLSFSKLKKNFWQVTATVSCGAQPVDVDTINLTKADSRAKYAKRLTAKLHLEPSDVGQAMESLEARLVEAVATAEEDEEGEEPSQVEYIAREDEEHPNETGFYSVNSFGERRLSNFVAHRYRR